MMTWLVVVVAVALLVALAFRRHKPPQNEADYRVMVELHAIRRRFNLAQFKFDVRRDAADARRELRDKLDELDRPRRQR